MKLTHKFYKQKEKKNRSSKLYPNQFFFFFFLVLKESDIINHLVEFYVT